MQAGKRRNGAIELDLGRYELRRRGRRVKLEKKPMEPLIFMVSRREQLVSRRDIVTKLRGSNLFTDTEPNINNIVRKIRTALGDNSTKPRFLGTVVGKGYRFSGPVRVIDACYPNSNFDHRYPIGIERERSSRWGERSSLAVLPLFLVGLLPMIRALALGLPMHWFRALEICKVWTFCRLRRY